MKGGEEFSVRKRIISNSVAMWIFSFFSFFSFHLVCFSLTNYVGLHLLRVEGQHTRTLISPQVQQVAYGNAHLAYK